MEAVDALPIPTDDALALSRLLRRTRGQRFRLVVVQVSDPSQERAVIAWLQERARDLKLTEERVALGALPGENLWLELGEVIAASGLPGILMLTDLTTTTHPSDPARPDLLQQLNVQRDILVRDFPCLWVLLVYPHVYQSIQTIAPDFADFVSLWIQSSPPASASPRPHVVEDGGKQVASFAGLHDALKSVWQTLNSQGVAAAYDQLSVLRIKEGERLPPAEVALVLAEIEAFDGSPAQAADRLKAALSLAEDPMQRARILMARARHLSTLGRLKELELCLSDARTIFASAGNQEGLAQANRLMARLLSMKGEQARALAILQKVHAYFSGETAADSAGVQASKNKMEIAITRGDIARIMTDQGEVDEALRLHQQSLEDFQELGDKRSAAVMLGDIARIMKSKGDVDSALKLHQQRLDDFRELGDKRSAAVTLGDIARIMKSKGDVDGALKLHQQRLDDVRELGDVSGEAHTLWSIGTIDLARGRNAEAITALRRSYELLVRIGRADSIVVVGETYALALMQSGRPQDAAVVLTSIVSLAQKLGWTGYAEMFAAVAAQLCNAPPQPPEES